MLDVLFQNIAVADGSGAPIFRADVGLRDGKIAVIGQGVTEEAREIISAEPDMVLAPGFIDLHTHNDMLRLMDPDMKPQVLQGVTYDLCGNCGISIAPVNDANRDMLRKYIGTVIPVDRAEEEWHNMHTFQDFMDAVDRRDMRIHTGAFVGHGAVRIAVMGMENRAPTPDELERMKALVREAMEAGAKGISSGLIYIPGVYSNIDEMVALCEVVAEYGGIYATHMRNESFNVIESIKEALEVARRSGVKLLVSHLKVVADSTQSKHRELLRLMDEARAEGINVICDQYLYDYGSTMLNALFPPKYQSEGVPALLEKIADPEIRKDILRDLEEDGTYENFFYHMGPQSILAISCPLTPQYNNMHLPEIAEKMGISPAEAAAELLLSNEAKMVMGVRLSDMSVIDEIWQHPFTAAGSDGIGAGSGALTHPRAYGAFVRIFETFVRERGVVSLEEAVRKATSLPAGFLGLSTKGLIKEGNDADIVVFDKEKIHTGASFADPIVEPVGICYVYVDGKLVVKDTKIV